MFLPDTYLYPVEDALVIHEIERTCCYSAHVRIVDKFFMKHDLSCSLQEEQCYPWYSVHDRAEKTMEHVESMKMILGEMGIKILKVLRLGPMDMRAINFLSGVPMACVKGRIPVLKSLNMIKETEATYSLDKEGEQFLKLIGSSDEF
jgi:hypothetical protein